MAGNSETISDTREGFEIDTPNFSVTVAITGRLLGSVDGPESGFRTIADNVSLDNSGLISGYAGVDLDGNGDSLVNRARGNITGDYGVVGTFGNDTAIVNAGFIEGLDSGILLEGQGERLLNTGTISSSVYGPAIILYQGGVVTNTGMITSKSGTALKVGGSASAGTVHNSGTMDGDVKFTAGSNVYDGTGGTIDGALAGGTGNDSFDLSHQTVIGLVSGGGGEDKISFATASGGMTVDLLHGSATGAESFRISGIADVAASGYADHIIGDGGSNAVVAGAGNDVVQAGAGNDVINGGAGRDALSGGAGADRFVFSVISDSPYGGNPDVITDFTSGSDTIDLTALHLVSTAQIRIVNAQGNSFVIVDADDNGTPDMMIEALGLNAVKLGDIITGIVLSAPAHPASADAHDLDAALHAVAADHGLYA